MAFGRCRKCRGGTPAGERARSGRAAQAAFPWRAPHAVCVRVVDYCVCRRSISLYFFFVARMKRSEIRERHQSSSIVPSDSLRFIRVRCTGASTSLFDITRAQSRAARPGSYCIRSRASGGVTTELARRARVVEGASATLTLRCRSIRERRRPAPRSSASGESPFPTLSPRAGETCGNNGDNQSAWMLASLTIFCHSPSWVFMKSPSSGASRRSLRSRRS